MTKCTRTEIILGARIEDKIVVESGLEIGKKIVTKGLVNMRDGLSVKVVEQDSLTLPNADNQGVQ